MIDKKPIKRSRIRTFMGKKYYTTRKHLRWFLSKDKFAVKRRCDKMFIVKEHKTPLLRKLRNVDMRLQYNKIKNLSLAAEKLNGVIIRPGERFSYWKLIGKPSKRKGYLNGLVLNPDGGFGEGTGGGLCQLSNLVYWITLHTELEVVERYRHSHDVFPDVNRKQPFGSGATCVYNYLDLQIKNNTNKEYKLIVSLDDEFLYGRWECEHGELHSYEVYEKHHRITKGWWGGYVRNNTIFRKVYNGENEEIDDQFLTENHAVMMYNPLLQECEQKR